jgi:hypothetical protein
LQLDTGKKVSDDHQTQRADEPVKQQTRHAYLTITEQNRVNNVNLCPTLAKGKAQCKMNPTTHKEE